MTIPYKSCLLYTSDAADEEDSVDLGGRRIIKKKTTLNNQRNRLFFTDCFLAKFPPEICREIGPEIGRFFWEFAPENPSI